MMRTAVILAFLTTAAFADTYYVDQSHPDARDRGPGTDDTPFKTLRRAAKAIKGGDTVIVMPGVYREGVAFSASGTPDNPTVIRASENYKVVVTGADVVTGWERNAPLVTRQTQVFEEPEEDETTGEGGLDEALDAVGADPSEISKEHAAAVKKQDAYDKGITSIWVKKKYRYRIMSYYPPHHFEQVILDGRPLSQVFRKEEMKPGTFYCGEKDLFVWPPVVPDPGGGRSPDNWWEDLNQGHTVEVSRRGGTIYANGDFIHVKGFIFRYGCNQAQHSLAGGGGRGVMFEDCIAEYSGGTGIGVSGEGVVMRRIIARYNGCKGATTGFCWNGLWEDVELAYNNTKHFSPMFECGGTKCCGQRDCVFRRVHAHHNWGPGVWLDIDNRDCIFEDCWANDNRGPGFVAEISQGITWRNCVSIRNGSGIGIWESFRCTIEHCTLVDNGTGIRVRGGSLGGARGLTGWPRRDVGIVVPYRVGDLVVRNNVLAYNRFGITAVNHPDDFKMLDGNLYWPRWDTGAVCRVGGMQTLQQLRSAGFELHGRVGPPLFVNRHGEDFHLRDGSAAGGMCRPLLDVGKDKDGSPRDQQQTSAGACELAKAQRTGDPISEEAALAILAARATKPVSSTSGLELRCAQSFHLLWQNKTIVASDSLSINGAVSRPRFGRRIWHSGNYGQGAGTVQFASGGKAAGYVSEWNDPEVAWGRRQVSIEGNTMTAAYRVAILPGCDYRPTGLTFGVTLPRGVYAGAAFRFEGDKQQTVEGQELPEKSFGVRTFTSARFHLSDAVILFTSDQPFHVGWNARSRQHYLSGVTRVDPARGLDRSWGLKITVAAPE